MFTKSSRKLICFLLSLLMVVGLCIFSGATLLRSTLCYQNYMERFISSEKVVNYCNTAYNERIAILAENSGIPLRVFEATENVGGYSETVTSRFYSGSDTTMFTQDRIETYEKLIKEYLDGNALQYNENQVHNTAVKAAEIYADSYGLKNLSVFKSFVDDVVDGYGRVSSTGLSITMIAAALIFVMYSDNKKTVKYYTSSFTATGLSFIFIGIASLVTSLGKSSVITPVVYSKAIFSAVNCMFVILILTGVVITAVSTVVTLRQNKLTRKTRNK